MSLTYTTYVAALQNIAVEPASGVDTNFQNILPSVIDYAEGRIYRELDLLTTVTTDTSKSFTAGNRALTLPTSPRFVVAQQFNVITPAATLPASGTRNPMQPVSREYLDFVWPSATGTGRPTSYAMLTDQSIIVGPWPDAAYVVEIVGTVRPAPLSPTNTTTYLSLYLPDLLIAASMVYVAGFQRDFGAQSDDPKLAQSWENQYQLLKGSAATEEMRKKILAAPDMATASRPIA